MSAPAKEKDRIHVADRFFFEELKQIVGLDASYQWLSKQTTSGTAGRDQTSGRFKPVVSLVRAVRKGDSGKFQSRAEEDQRVDDVDVPDEVRRRYASLDVGNEIVGDKKKHCGASEDQVADKSRLPSAGNSVLELANLNNTPKDNLNKSCSNEDLSLLYTDAAHMVLD